MSGVYNFSSASCSLSVRTRSPNTITSTSRNGVFIRRSENNRTYLGKLDTPISPLLFV